MQLATAADLAFAVPVLTLPIKAAIARLGRLRLRSEASRRSLRAFDGALSMVRLSEFDPSNLPTVTYTRLNAHYRSAVELARLILRSTSFELGHGLVDATAFLLDMNQVFEDFVVVALREALGLTESTLVQGAKGRSLTLDEARLVALQPDIS